MNTQDENKPLNKVQYLRDAIAEGVVATMAIKDAQSRMTDIIDVTAEKLEMDKPEIRKMIAVSYQKEYDPEGYAKGRDLADTVYGFVEENM